MHLLACLAALCLTASAALAAPPQAGTRPDHVADRNCLACHAEQASAWTGSKHQLAMQPATPDTVLGDFADARFAGKGEAAHFLRRGDAFHVTTEGADGQRAELPVTHTFGIRPLQQVLLPQPGGRLQAFTIAWDTDRKTWFSLYPEGANPPGSNLHWSGRYQNWNLMCGECHTTAYRKGYDDTSDSYRTTWAEANVGCQACHGGGRAHAESARTVAAAGQGTPKPTANRALAGAHAQVDQCAACHARRTRLVEDAVAGAPLLDQFMPDNLRADLYHADGQQLEEVFEYGSYRQSRMYQAGVACTDCHDPHSGKPRAEGNALCTACHNPSPDRTRFPGLIAKNYDVPAHHFHRAGQAGSQCVDCHMPSRNYMVVHGRRDHAIRIPRPDLSATLGTPNACQDCHADRSPEWAAAITRHLGPRLHPPHYGEIISAARRGEPRAAQQLHTLITDPAQPAIVRATAVETLAALGSVPPTTLRDPDPVVRATAVGAFATRPAEERLAHLPALLSDPLRAVRISAARGLADVDETRLTGEQRMQLQAGLTAFVAAQQAMADMPSAQLNLASLAGLASARRAPAAAERHYRRALAQDPLVQAARLGLATLLAGSAREDEAERVLREGLSHSTQPGELHLALGLLAGQRKEWEKAAHELRAAAALMPDHPRVRRNLDAVERYLQQRR